MILALNALIKKWNKYIHFLKHFIQNATIAIWTPKYGSSFLC